MSHTNDVKQRENQGWDGRILVFHNDDLVDTFIILTTRYVVVMDTMINAKTAESLLAYAKPHLENGRSLLVINTHADYDHAWGNQVFAALGAPIIGHRLTINQFNDPKTAEFLRQCQTNEPDIFADVRLTPPTILFDDNLTIEGGDLTLQLLHTPGHTPDHCALYIPQIKTLIAADGAELPFPAARTTAGLPAMRQSLAKMAALDAETVLYCHAPVTIGRQLLLDNIAYFDKVENHCRTALEQGKISFTPTADADVATLIGLSFDDATPHNAYWQDVHPYYRTIGHAQQILALLEWLKT